MIDSLLYNCAIGYDTIGNNGKKIHVYGLRDYENYERTFPIWDENNVEDSKKHVSNILMYALLYVQLSWIKGKNGVYLDCKKSKDIIDQFRENLDYYRQKIMIENVGYAIKDMAILLDKIEYKGVPVEDAIKELSQMSSNERKNYALPKQIKIKYDRAMIVNKNGVLRYVDDQYNAKVDADANIL